MKIAVIDCGTNTFHLLIGELIDGHLTVLFKKRLFVYLGEGGGKIILDSAIKRATDAFITFKEHIREYNVINIRAFGTAMLRNAQNTPEFIQEIQHLFKIDIKIISGIEEAKLIYQGVAGYIFFEDQPKLIMDIGGGSVEFIIANNQGILWADSLPIGVAILYNNFQSRDPIPKNEVVQMQSFIKEHIKALIDQVANYDIQEMVGASGSFEIVEALTNVELDNDQVIIPLKEVRNLYATLLTSSESERLLIEKMPKDRVKLIVSALILLNFVLNQFQSIQQIRISPYALKEGAFYNI